MNKLIVREGARRVDTCPPCNQVCSQGRFCTARQDSPLYTPEVVMTWPELGMTLLVTAVTVVMAAWFFAANWPRLVVWLS